MVLVTGGKNDKECHFGSDSVWILEQDKWRQGPSMNVARFHHSCVLTEVGDETFVVVVGGIGPANVGDSVEMLSLTGDVFTNQWKSLPSLTKPHPNQPVLGHMSGYLLVTGGAGYPYPGGETSAEMLTDQGWVEFRHVGVERSFGLNIQVPSKLTENCQMEPNFGGHRFFRRQGEAWLSDKIWFCHGDKLEMPLTRDRRHVTTCTVPGCQFYQIPSNLMTRADMQCQVQDDMFSVVCSLNCTAGYTPVAGQDSSSCTRDTRSWSNRYLECQETEPV